MNTTSSIKLVEYVGQEVTLYLNADQECTFGRVGTVLEITHLGILLAEEDYRPIVNFYPWTTIYRISCLNLN